MGNCRIGKSGKGAVSDGSKVAAAAGRCGGQGRWRAQAAGIRMNPTKAVCLHIPGRLPPSRIRFPRWPVSRGTLPGKDAPATLLESRRGLPKQNLRVSPRCLTDLLASIARDLATMRPLAVIFILALIAIAG